MWRSRQLPSLQLKWRDLWTASSRQRRHRRPVRDDTGGPLETTQEARQQTTQEARQRRHKRPVSRRHRRPVRNDTGGPSADDTGGPLEAILRVAALRRDLLLGVELSASVSGRGRRHRRGPGHHQRRHGRHGGPFGQRVLADVVEVLYAKQLRLDDELLAAGRNRTALRSRLTDQEDRLQQLEMKMERAERERQQLGWRLNATDRSGAASALKQSTSVLIREVEQLETKLDSKVSTLQSELARLDVSCSQLAASVGELRQRQAGLPEHADKLSQQVAALSQQQLVTRSQLMALQSDLLTLSLERPDQTPSSDPDT